MNRSILAACAVVSLCGTSHGWSLLTLGQPWEEDNEPAFAEDIRPSSGFIRLAEVFDTSSSAYVPEFNNNTYGFVTGAAATWSTRRAEINNSSWFAGDSSGPNGSYTTGSGATNRPAWNDGYMSSPTYGGLGTPTGMGWIGSGDGDNLVTRIDGGIPGWSFAFDVHPSQGFSGMPSNISPLGGPSIMDGKSYDWAQSVFVGRITLTDPTAHLTGPFLVTTRDLRGLPEGFRVDLNGTTSFNLKAIQVRDGNSINLFIVEVPAPGVLGALMFAGIASSRRCR